MGTRISFDDKIKKGSKGMQESPGAYRMGIFWKIHIINPPEVRGQDIRLKRKKGTTMVNK
jgi:hypothetical protein